jgi:type IV pilus assembly protein PilV
MRRIMKKPANTLSRQSGLSMLEVLVALVVLSIGLLGTAALQIQALQSAHSSYQRTIASVIAADAAERLWVQLSTGTVNRATVETAWRNHWSASPIPPNVVTLPGFAGTITQNGIIYTITVTWDEPRFADAAGGQTSFVYTTNLLPGK